MLTSGAFVQIAARYAVGIQNVAFRTRTDETAFRIHAREFARRWIQLTLVDVYSEQQ